MTYYDVLEVAESASDDVIRTAYKTLAKKYHPDVFTGDPKIAEEKMKQLNAAYEVLINPETRKQYDLFLKEQRSKQQHNTYEATPNNRHKKSRPAKKDSKIPTKAKSTTIIILLLFLNFSQVLNPYIESGIDLVYDYAVLFALKDLALLSLIMMIAPMLIGAIKADCTVKHIKRTCALNSLIVFIISVLLYIFELTPVISIGWIIVIFYYFINKHLLLQIRAKHQEKKPRLLIVVSISLFLCAVIALGTVFTNSIVDSLEEGTIDTENVVSNSEPSEKVVLDPNSVAIRTVAFGDEFTAEYILAKWNSGPKTEEHMADIMKEYGSEYNDGTLQIVKQGEYVEEIDSWCFAPGRKAGDVAIIENPYGYSICYISAVHN